MIILKEYEKGVGVTGIGFASQSWICIWLITQAEKFFTYLLSSELEMIYTLLTAHYNYHALYNSSVVSVELYIVSDDTIQVVTGYRPPTRTEPF